MHIHILHELIRKLGLPDMSRCLYMVFPPLCPMCRHSYDYTTSIRKLRVHFQENTGPQEDQNETKQSDRKPNLDDEQVRTADSGTKEDHSTSEPGNGEDCEGRGGES